MDIERIQALTLLAILDGRKSCTVEDILRYNGVLGQLMIADAVSRKAIDQPAEDKFIVDLRNTVLTTAYQTVALWTVGDGKAGKLYGIEWECEELSQYALVQWKLTINDLVVFEDKLVGSSVSLSWYGGAKVAAGKSVKLEARLTSGSGTANADITGVEVAA